MLYQLKVVETPPATTATTDNPWILVDSEGEEVRRLLSVVQLTRNALQAPDLQNILRQSYDNAKVMINLRSTLNLPNVLQRTQGFA